MLSWICQTNLGSQDDIRKIRAACEKYEYGFYGVDVVPFSDEIGIDPDIIEGETIFYGATRWIERVSRQGGFHPGTFLNKESVSSVWLRKYGFCCINATGYYDPETPLTFNDPRLVDYAKIYSVDGYIFVRPDKDDKLFAGQVVKVEDLLDWSEKVCFYEEFKNEPIIISQPERIKTEWRLFIVNGEVVSGSQYRSDGRLDVRPGYPEDIVPWVHERIENYEPSPVFVMDVCKVFEHDEYMIIEVGCFNSAGFYGSDIDKIVNKVSTFASCFVNSSGE